MGELALGIIRFIRRVCVMALGKSGSGSYAVGIVSCLEGWSGNVAMDDDGSALAVSAMLKQKNG